MGEVVGIDTRLRKLREEQGWTLEEAASRQGFSWRALRNYERGERTPGAVPLRDLAKRYRVSSDWLLGLTRTRNNG